MIKSIFYRKRHILASHLIEYGAMGWLRLVGSFKLQVSFAKEPYKRDYILQKRSIIRRSLLIIATPYADVYMYMYSINTAPYSMGKGTYLHLIIYGMATVSRIDKIIGLFCRILSLL